MKNGITAQLKKIGWEYLVNRQMENLLMFSITHEGYALTASVTGLGWRAKNAVRVPNGDLFYHKDELAKLRGVFARCGIKGLRDFIRRLCLYVPALDALSWRLEKTDFTRYTQKQLADSTRVFMHTAMRAHNFLAPFPVADGVLAGLINALLPSAAPEQKQQWLSILVYPDKENYHTEEERAFHHLARAYARNDKKFAALLNTHLTRFAWIGSRGYHFEEGWTEKDMRKRLKNFFAQGGDPNQKIRQLAEIKKERVRAARALLKHLGVKRSSTLFKYIILARKFAYLRTYRTDVIYRAGYRVRKLFAEVARRGGHRLNDIEYLTTKEIIACAAKSVFPINAKELAQRKKEYVLVLFNERLHFFTDTKTIQKLLALTPKISVEGGIKGTVAFPGKTRGRVKVVYTSADISKVLRGDILVAVMTFPNLVPAMEKAAAFVTDEGGILCHAAIVSREMKKPCIIGTKIATKILRDGDRVEVDAVRGEIRIL